MAALHADTTCALYFPTETINKEGFVYQYFLKNYKGFFLYNLCVLAIKINRILSLYTYQNNLCKSFLEVDLATKLHRSKFNQGSVLIQSF